MSEQRRFHGAMEGIVALEGRREKWMNQLFSDGDLLAGLVEDHGSPLNFINAGSAPVHARELVDAAAGRGVDLRVFFARKSNKALAIVDAVLSAGHGVDVASYRELDQVLSRLSRTAASTGQIIVTAAVKPAALLDLCLRADVTTSVDNIDELQLLRRLAAGQRRQAKVALRLAPEIPDTADSRFGEPAAQLRAVLNDPEVWRDLQFQGIHFHLDGYRAIDRALALHQAIDLIEFSRRSGHSPEFVDIGGGVPMSYLDGGRGWREFWTRHDTGDRMTWRDRPVGTVYPAWQSPVRGAWLEELLDLRIDAHGSVADRLAEADVRLHLEPGRALVDGCGITVARVEFRKQQRDGTWLIGLAMNRTQCRSAADDFLVDPILIPSSDGPRTPPGEGYLVGAYCVEAELMTFRRMRFPVGVAVGDFVAFVNTAGYLMHILESASHQIPLARNLALGPDGQWQLDEIDAAQDMARSDRPNVL